MAAPAVMPPAPPVAAAPAPAVPKPTMSAQKVKEILKPFHKQRKGVPFDDDSEGLSDIVQQCGGNSKENIQRWWWTCRGKAAKVKTTREYLERIAKERHGVVFASDSTEMQDAICALNISIDEVTKRFAEVVAPLSQTKAMEIVETLASQHGGKLPADDSPEMADAVWRCHRGVDELHALWARKTDTAKSTAPSKLWTDDMQRVLWNALGTLGEGLEDKSFDKSITGAAALTSMKTEHGLTAAEEVKSGITAQKIGSYIEKRSKLFTSLKTKTPFNLKPKGHPYWRDKPSNIKPDSYYSDYSTAKQDGKTTRYCPAPLPPVGTDGKMHASVYFGAMSKTLQTTLGNIG